MLQQSGKMERFWVSTDTCRQGLCDPNLFERSIFEDNQYWIHSVPGVTPAQVQDQLDFWGAADIDRDVNKNL
jgi:hypothetical protein